LITRTRTLHPDPPLEAASVLELEEDEEEEREGEEEASLGADLEEVIDARSSGRLPPISF